MIIPIQQRHPFQPDKCARLYHTFYLTRLLGLREYLHKNRIRKIRDRKNHQRFLSALQLSVLKAQNLALNHDFPDLILYLRDRNRLPFKIPAIDNARIIRKLFP